MDGESPQLTPQEFERLTALEEAAWRADELKLVRAAHEAEEAAWIAHERKLVEAAHRAMYESGERAPIPSQAKSIFDVGGAPGELPRFVAEDLIPDGQILLICGEEGIGKSWLEHQMAGELLSGSPVLGEFEVPEPVRSVLIVDFEQSDEDVTIIRDEMLQRGVLAEGANLRYLDAVGRVWDSAEDFKWLVGHVMAERPDVLMLDTATDSVSKPTDTESVAPLMFALSRFVAEKYVRAVVGLAQPRKEGQSKEAKGRSFDSLFGSRLWKSRPSAHFWVTPTRLTVWKQRGRWLEKRWGKPAGARYMYATLTRPEIGPPTIAGPPVGDEDRRRSQAKEIEAEITRVVTLHVGKFNKSELAGQVNKRKSDVLARIDLMRAEGRLEADPKGKLSLATPEPDIEF